MKSLNFEFLRGTQPALADYAVLAEQYIVTDPAAALVKMRMSAESLVEAVHEQTSLAEPKPARGGSPVLHDLHNDSGFRCAVPRALSMRSAFFVGADSAALTTATAQMEMPRSMPSGAATTWRAGRVSPGSHRSYALARALR